MKNTHEQFELIAEEVISFVRKRGKATKLKKLEKHFKGRGFPIPVGRVVLQLLADHRLYLTENRDVKVTQYETIRSQP